MSQAMKLIYIIIFISLMGLLMGGCDLFETREAEIPVGSANIWNPPANPREVLDNISLAFSLHDGLLYMKSFAQTGYSDSAFMFHPDWSSASYDSTIFADWGYSAEQSFILTLFSQDFIPLDSTASIQFIAESEPPGEILPIYRENYTIIIQHTQSNLPKEFSGRADIKFDRNHNSDWVIIAWTDEQTGNDPSLTELKSTLSN